MENDVISAAPVVLLILNALIGQQQPDKLGFGSAVANHLTVEIDKVIEFLHRANPFGTGTRHLRDPVDIGLMQSDLIAAAYHRDS